jgi:hypothetical protein
MTVEEIIEIFKPWIYNDENQAGTQLEVIDASDLPMIAERIVKNCNIGDVVGRSEQLKAIEIGNDVVCWGNTFAKVIEVRLTGYVCKDLTGFTFTVDNKDVKHKSL